MSEMKTTVSQAVAARKSVRAFLDTPVGRETLREVLSLAARAPSGGNLQPWRLFILEGATMAAFKAHVRTKLAEGLVEEPAYQIYPPKLKEPYRTHRYRVGEDMYALLGISREDKPARLAWLMRNFEFFDAPAGLFCFVDRTMGPPQWSDLGMYLQTVMLLLAERGLDSCAQEAWATCSGVVADYVGAPEDWMLFCGMAIGHADADAPVNRLSTHRAPFEDFAQFVGG